jgi:hypothetical protein
MIGFEYADENATPCKVAVAIAPNAWSVGLSGVKVRLDMTPFDGIMRSVGDSLAASGTGVSFANARLVLGSVLTPLQGDPHLPGGARPARPIRDVVLE